MADKRMPDTPSSFPLFSSFVQAGFECSTQKLGCGRRLDLLESTGHQRFLPGDYSNLRRLGIATVREGARWHLIRQSNGSLDMSSVLPFLVASRRANIQIVWDLLHFGWPDELDLFSAAWIEEFSEFAFAFARLLRAETGAVPMVIPINEISFLSWAAGEVGYLNPFQRGRGRELKAHLIKAWVAAVRAIRYVLPCSRILTAEPVIHLIGNPAIPGQAEAAEAYRCAMFEAWDMMLGRLNSELGGSETALDVIGVNYYDRNQTVNFDRVLNRNDPDYRPFHQILLDVHERYRLPMFVAETGTENEDRPDWLAYIMDETRKAISLGVGMKGVCLYPVLNHAGWDDDRHCYNGLWDYPSPTGQRVVYRPLREEVVRQQSLMKDPNMPQPNEPSSADLVCFSHLRWNFVFQRPQHLMSRFARQGRVFFVEEPLREGDLPPYMRLGTCPTTGVRIATPILPNWLNTANSNAAISSLVDYMFQQHDIQRYVAWYYTPMAMEYRPPLPASATIYDCMDELSLFHQAPPSLKTNESDLFRLSDLVFTGGISLYEAKRSQHDRVHAFPSSVDCDHFFQARSVPDSAEDQIHLPRPRLGYAGVIDERIDMELIRALANRQPDWQFVMIGPVVKIDASILPRCPNIHWLGSKNYRDLPKYFAGWDIALMPFALNDSTRFISPTKTPEYLAAGLPVITTAIHDVVRQYGERGLVYIATDAAAFVSCAQEILNHGVSPLLRDRIDSYLATLSWESTWKEMDGLIRETLESKMPMLSQLSPKVEVEPTYV